MDYVKQFFDLLQKEMAVTLATASNESVTMRAVSPVPDGGTVLMFTDPSSRKYRQLRENPHCCLAAGSFYAECTSEFLGDTMAAENGALREKYDAKFPGAFDPNTPLGGVGAEFLRLTPKKLTGWAFENGVPTPDGVPTIPVSIDLA